MTANPDAWTKKEPARERALFSGVPEESAFVLLFVELPVLLTEFVDSTCRVHELSLASVERMALVAHLHLHKRVLIAILPLDGFLCLGCRLAEESVFVAHVLEHNQPIVLWVNALFHLSRFQGCKLTKNLNKRKGYSPLIFR